MEFILSLDFFQISGGKFLAGRKRKAGTGGEEIREDFSGFFSSHSLSVPQSEEKVNGWGIPEKEEIIKKILPNLSNCPRNDTWFRSVIAGSRKLRTFDAGRRARFATQPVVWTFLRSDNFNG